MCDAAIVRDSRVGGLEDFFSDVLFAARLLLAALLLNGIDLCDTFRIYLCTELLPSREPTVVFVRSYVGCRASRIQQREIA